LRQDRRTDPEFRAMPQSTSSAASARSSSPAITLRAWLRRPWVWAVIAFLVGLLLAAIVLMRGEQDDFFRADEETPSAGTRQYAPLPTPLPANGAESARLPRMAGARRAEDAGPRLVETRPAPPPPAADREQARSSAYVDPQPISGRTPAPRYPPRALRRGEEGVVNVRVQIGPDGVPTSVSLVSGSGSRDLDRAALDAVRRWRFRPAQQDGRPTVGSVVVPIAFERD
jgi:protein TonB